MSIGIGQVGLTWLGLDPQVNKLAKTASQNVTNFTQQIGMSQLAEQHGRQLNPTGEALGVTFALVYFHQNGEFISRNLFEKLTE